MRFKLSLLALPTLLSLQFFSCPALLAHSGGNPYVLISGDYAKPNPLSGVQPNFPQDLALANYTVGQPVDFTVDYNVFGAPGYQFRWLWASKTSFSDGGKVTHTFDKPGSYIITMQLKSSGADTDFIDTDTIGINILPKPTYRVPTAQVKLQQTAKSPTGSTVKLTAVPTNDPSSNIASYQWTFADGTSGQGQAVEHLYKNLGNDYRLFPSLRVTDSNGLYSDLLFELDSNTGVIKALDAVSMPGVIMSSIQSPRSPVSVNLLWLALPITVVALAALILAIVRAKKPKPKNS